MKYLTSHLIRVRLLLACSVALCLLWIGLPVFIALLFAAIFLLITELI